MTRRSAGSTPATLALTRAGISFTLHRYDHQDQTTSYGDEAAAALGIDPARIFKTLVVEVAGIVGASGPGGQGNRVIQGQIDDLTKLDPHSGELSGSVNRLLVAVVPVAHQLDLKTLAAAVGASRAQLANPSAAQRSTGYVVGGISPIAQRTRLRTVVDASAAEFETIMVSAGRRGLQIELAPADLTWMTQAVKAPITRG